MADSIWSDAPPWRWHWIVNTRTSEFAKCLAWRERVDEWPMHEHVDFSSVDPRIPMGAMLGVDWRLANECEGPT